MLQFRHHGAPPSIAEVRTMFDLGAEEIDSDFGVISTDPNDNLFVVLVDGSAKIRVEAALHHRPADPAEGLFANPTVEPFDPTEG